MEGKIVLINKEDSLLSLLLKTAVAINPIDQLKDLMSKSKSRYFMHGICEICEQGHRKCSNNLSQFLKIDIETTDNDSSRHLKNESNLEGS